MDCWYLMSPPTHIRRWLIINYKYVLLKSWYGSEKIWKPLFQLVSHAHILLLTRGINSIKNLLQFYTAIFSFSENAM